MIKEIVESLTDNFMTIVFTLVVSYLVIHQFVVPEWLVAIVASIVAFYFTQK